MKSESSSERPETKLTLKQMQIVQEGRMQERSYYCRVIDLLAERFGIPSEAVQAAMRDADRL